MGPCIVPDELLPTSREPYRFLWRQDWQEDLSPGRRAGEQSSAWALIDLGTPGRGEAGRRQRALGSHSRDIGRLWLLGSPVMTGRGSLTAPTARNSLPGPAPLRTADHSHGRPPDLSDQPLGAPGCRRHMLFPHDPGSAAQLLGLDFPQRRGGAEPSVPVDVASRGNSHRRCDQFRTGPKEP